MVFQDDQALYSSRIINTYIKLIKKRYSFINVGELLKQSKMKSYQIEDEGHWFTQEQVDLFYENVKKLTHNHHIAREAGRYAASPEAMGIMRHFILGCVDPATAYLMLEKAVVNFTKSSTFKVNQINSSAVEIIVEATGGACEKHYQCENRIGYIEAVSLIFNYRLPKIKHPECMVYGGKVCKYIVSWKNSPTAFFKKIRNYVTVSMLVLCSTAGLFLPQFALPLALSSIFVFLAVSLYAEILHKNEYQFALKSLMGSSDELLNQINVNYNNAMLANELGQSINKKLSVEGVANEVIQVVQKRLDYDRGIILMVDKQRKKLIYQAGFGYTEKQLETLMKTDFHLDPDSRGVFVRCVLKKKPFLINNVDDIINSLSPRSLEYMRTLNSTSFICCPIIYEGETLGIFAVDNVNNKRPLYQSDMNLLMGITPEIGISFHNATLIESKERQFKSILKTLAASIDARDPLTAGHSERVTQYSLGICKEMNLGGNFCEIIKVAALLHDYGKIGISDSILKKEDALTPEEYQEIQTHAEKTRTILEQINFEGIYKAVPAIAGSHHEKFDGSGYPKGLKGKEIPMGARIIAVADVFEAITAKRHYRNPMPEKVAIGIIAHQSGKHFDREIVQAFFSYYNKLKTGDKKECDFLIDRNKICRNLLSGKGFETSADNQRCIGKPAGI
jgi:HD-GYP domain-containing protein (c-di-GMP phosphodiesterase class II)